MTIKCLKTEAGKLPHKILILFQFTILTLSNANADAFFDHYSSGRFEQAYDSFETSVQDSRPNSNYETYLNVLMDVFAQQDNKSINSENAGIQLHTRVYNVIEDETTCLGYIPPGSTFRLQFCNFDVVCVLARRIGFAVPDVCSTRMRPMGIQKCVYGVLRENVGV